MSAEYRAFIVRGDDGQEYGPVDREELREWVQENRAGLGTVVRLDEPGAAWHPWQHYPELVALLAEVHVTSPIPGQPGLVIASLGRRILAFVMDLILSSFLATPIVYAVMNNADLPDWQEQVWAAFWHPENHPMSPQLLHAIVLCNLVKYVVITIYMTGFHAVYGRTPCKSLLHLRVVDQTGEKPKFFKSFLRALALVFSLNFYGIPLIYAFLNPQRCTFHDFIAGTYVVEA